MSLLQILIIIGVLLVSMSVHEAMHAFVGYKLGDDTAAEEGRISLNPFKHIDPFLTIILPTITLLIAGIPILAAKPVPFNPENVRYEEFGAALLAIAGPLSNLVLAVAGAAAMRLLAPSGIMETVMMIFVVLNVALFVFNILPIPPLDGSRVLYAFSPEPLQRFLSQIEPYGFFILIGLIFTGVLFPIVRTMNQFFLQLLGV